MAAVRRHGLLLALLGCRLVLGLVYSAVIPPWEGVDEDAHFAYAQYLVAHGHLLDHTDPEAAAIRENHQPPLYYALIAMIVAPLGASQPYPDVTLNPYLPYGSGYNHAIQPLQPDEAARSLMRALYAARALTTLLVTASALAVYALARRLWPADRLAALTSAALYAFWPQALYLSSVVNNDALALALSALVLYAAVRVAHDGWRPAGVLWLGGSLAAAVFTKLNGLALLLPAALALAWGVAVRPQGPARRDRRQWLALGVAGLLVIGVLLAVAQLDFVRAQILKVQTLDAFVDSVQRDRWFGLVTLLPGLSHALRSSLAEFGWGNIYLPGPFYVGWGVALVVAILALADSFFEKETRLPQRFFLVALGQVAAVVGLALALGIATGSGFIVLGRYMLPAWPAAALLWVAGWRRLSLRRWPQIGLKVLGVGVLLTGWSAPWVSLTPAYARPALLAADAVVAHPLEVIFGESIELIGYQDAIRGKTAGTASVTLCWAASALIDRDVAIQLDAVDLDGEVRGTFTTYPGHGTFPTSQWPAGTRFCETYDVMAHAEAVPVAPAWIRVSLLDELTREPLVARDRSGAVLSSPVEIAIP